MSRRRPLADLKDRLHDMAQVDCALPGEDDLHELLGGRGDPHLFLDYYDEPAVWEGLERLGVLDRLRDQGLEGLSLQLETSDPRHHTLRVHGERRGERGLLAETALQVGRFETRADFAPRLHGRRLRLLFIHWLRMQNPFDPFPADRPALPGQDHPGLGIGREVIGVYRAIADRLHCDGILVCPEFGHTAVLYAVAFRFLDPEVEGQLAALRRDLRLDRDLVGGSWALHRGCVVHGDPPRPFRWTPREQVLATRPPLAAHFEDPDYTARVSAAARSWRFSVDEERLALLAREMDPPGLPRV